MRRWSALIAAAFLICQTVPASAADPIVRAPAGTVQGRETDGVKRFLGIPYAQPPVANLRWKAPQPMPRWSGTRTTAEFGPACFQPNSKVATVYSPRTPLPMSEDCLSLNIWSPSKARKAPVLVWIHGGALVTGSSREDMYDGRKLAERGIVVVSINYRLGVLGWLAHPGLSAENGDQLSGNYGLLDQIAALRWVKDNIGAFGGDASNVTISGESAGALSVMYLMSAPSAQGLFHKAIAQSAYMIAMPEIRGSAFGQPSGEAVGQMLQAGLKKADIAALRDMEPGALTDSAAGLGFFPWGLVDGKILPDQMVNVFDAGRQSRVPILAGFNQGEIRSLRILAPKAPPTAAEYEKEIRGKYGDLADRFLKLYPAADHGESILATTRDGLYGWTAERLVRKQAAVGQRSYLYLFDHGYPAMDSAGLHAFHASELPYMFGTADRLGPNWPKVPDTAAEKALSEAMLDYWTSFAASGTPKAKGHADWPAFDSSRSYMRFAGIPLAEREMMPGMYELNEEVMCRRRADGSQPWNWNVGLASPPLPPKASC